MKIDVPFYENPDDTHCFQACLKMILKYFFPEKDFSYEELDKMTGKIEGKWTWICLGLVALKKMGLKVKFYTTFDYRKFSEQGEKYLLERYKREDAEPMIKKSDIKSAMEDAKKMVDEDDILEFRTIDVNDIERWIKEKNLILAIIDVNVFKHKKGYAGHLAIVTGFEDKIFYLNDPGPFEPAKNKIVDKNLFMKSLTSRTGVGNEGNIILIRR